jgi:hypothetical protein
MHYQTILTSAGYLAAILVIYTVADRWFSRPAARARWRKLSLRDKIGRAIRARAIAVGLGAGYLAGFTIWHRHGLPVIPWLTFMTWAGVNMTVNAWYLSRAIGARREYRRLGWLTYLVEARHAFGQMTVPGATTESPTSGSNPSIPTTK